MGKYIYVGRAKHKTILLLRDAAEELKRYLWDGKDFDYNAEDFKAAYDELEEAIKEMKIWLNTAIPYR